jgi:WS/DGAT/MGAT family acyltransferase
MESMTPLDAAFLAIEDADPHAGLHIGSVGIFEGPAPAHEDVLHGIESKLGLVPRYRQRIRTVPLSLGPPVWVDDEDFDVRYHVRRTALPAPGDHALLRRLIGRVMSHRLDRDKPLWEAWVVEGLPDGRWALLSKIHHCMVDGVSGTDILAVMLDLTPQPAARTVQPWEPQPAPSRGRLVVDALTRQALEPARLVPGIVRAVWSPRASLATAGHLVRGAAQYVTELRPTDDTSLSGWTGSHRRWRTTSASFDDLKAVRSAFGGTLNDVALAAVTSGLRDLMLFRREEPGRHSVRTLVPVSTRAPGEEGIRDNRVSAMLADLPVHLSDPVDQLVAVQQEIGRHKEIGEADAGARLTRAARHVPFELVAPALRLAFRFPQHYLTTVTTNVPGPAFPLYAFGRRMETAYPFVPLGDRLRIGIAMFSYCGQMNFGITSDAATTPDADVLVTGIDRAVAALVERARERTATPRRGRPRAAQRKAARELAGTVAGR